MGCLCNAQQILKNISAACSPPAAICICCICHRAAGIQSSFVPQAERLLSLEFSKSYQAAMLPGRNLCPSILRNSPKLEGWTQGWTGAWAEFALCFKIKVQVSAIRLCETLRTHNDSRVHHVVSQKSCLAKHSTTRVLKSLTVRHSSRPFVLWLFYNQDYASSTGRKMKSCFFFLFLFFHLGYHTIDRSSSPLTGNLWPRYTGFGEADPNFVDL